MLPGKAARAASTVATKTWSFGCTFCGRCCTLGKDRAVLVSAQEVAALERHTSQPPSAFVQLSSDGKPTLRTGPGGACVFLDGARKCSVYEARPTQCATYPFWGETTTPLGWLREGARCEGIGRGPAIPTSAVALDVVQTDLALAGEATTYEDDRALLEAIPDVVMEQLAEQQELGGVVRWDTPELCVVDSPDPQTGRTLRTLVLKAAPSLSQSVAFLSGNDIVPTELAMPVHQALALALSFGRTQPARILVIGGGGCSLPLAFATVLPGAKVTAVELSGAVADVARRFFVPDARLDIVVADGADFVSSEKGDAFDLVVLDAADGAQSPAPALASDTFLRELHAKLTPDGLLAVNCFGDSAAFVRRVAGRFGCGTAVLDFVADESVHQVVFAQKGWTQGGAADTWRARLRTGPARLCSADITRHAADNLRPVQ